ncbi:MAG: sigma-70 family RNA polymerase sigma factor [Thermoleophilaceae bacterium]
MAAQGDSRAFAVIYERYHQPIYRYCHSILHDPDDAADALQNAMIKAMRGLDGNERDIALKPWLFRIAHNEAISLVRRRRPVATLESSEGPRADSADEDASTRERLAQLVEDLRELPDRQRGALLMRELGGLGFEEIGAIFGVSASAAKQTVYEARMALHEYVEGRGMCCEDARKSLSAGDRRMLRGRKLAAHLRDCPSCREFQELMRMRRRDVAALAPPISAGASAAILKGILGFAGGHGGGGGGLVAWLTGSGAKALAGSEAAKSMLAAALVTASAGAIGVVSALEQQGATSAGARTASPAHQLPAADRTPFGSTTIANRTPVRQAPAAHHHGSHSRTGPSHVAAPGAPQRADAPAVGGVPSSATATTRGTGSPGASSTATPVGLPADPPSAPDPVVALPQIAQALQDVAMSQPVVNVALPVLIGVRLPALPPTPGP